MPTGDHQNSRCYARALRGCSTRISLEHPISAAFLDTHAVNGIINLGGLAWNDNDEPLALPVRSVASKILCKAHNTALSPLDALAGDLMTALYDVRLNMRRAKRRKPFPTFVFSGDDIERWMLKCLCGLVASGMAEVKGVDSKQWQPEEAWLRTLFGEVALPDGFGLYFLGRPGDSREISPNFSAGLMSNVDVGPYALQMSMIEKEFAFAMAHPPKNNTNILSDALYRPARFIADNDINTQEVRFAWIDAARNGSRVGIQHRNPRKYDLA